MFDSNRYGHFILNYTPHSVVLLRDNNVVQETFDSIGVARCREQIVRLAPLHYDPYQESCGWMTADAPLVSKSFGAVEGLPAYDETRPWRMYIVSQIVADACPERDDLLVLSDVVRGPDGQIRGCRSFAWRASRLSTPPASVDAYDGWKPSR